MDAELCPDGRESTTMAQLSKAARQMLEDSNCFDEVADDYVSVANSDIVILLTRTAVEDLNRQARERAELA